MKKQVSTGVLAGAQTFLGNGKPWGFGNQNQMAAPLDPATQKMTNQEDAEINANLEHEEEVLGKWGEADYDYSFPATVHGTSPGPDNLTDLEKASKNIKEQSTVQGSQRMPADQNYFDLPGTPKRMWFAKPENHVPFDRKEPYEVEHFDDFLDELFADDEPLNLQKSDNTPNDFEATTSYQQGKLQMVPSDENRLVLDNPKHPFKGELEEQADATRWYLRSASAKAVTDNRVDTIRQNTEPLLLGDPELDDETVEMSPFSLSYLVKPRQWVKKEKDTDVRTLDDPRKKIPYDPEDLNESLERTISSPLQSWVATGNRNAFQTLARVAELSKKEDCFYNLAKTIYNLGSSFANDASARKRLHRIVNYIDEVK